MWPIRVVAILSSMVVSSCEPGTGPGDAGTEGLDSEYDSNFDGLDGYEGDAPGHPLTLGASLPRGGKARPAASMSSFHLAGLRGGDRQHPVRVGESGEDIMCSWSGP